MRQCNFSSWKHTTQHWSTGCWKPQNKTRLWVEPPLSSAWGKPTVQESSTRSLGVTERAKVAPEGVQAEGHPETPQDTHQGKSDIGRRTDRLTRCRAASRASGGGMRAFTSSSVRRTQMRARSAKERPSWTPTLTRFIPPKISKPVQGKRIMESPVALVKESLLSKCEK